MKLLCLSLTLLSVAIAKQGFGPTDQEWGYAEVRPKSFIFWWLHYTTADVKAYTDRPLVIWLQGGPGASSTGYGNFAEIGPWDSTLKERNTTWVKDANVLFVDNPVGTGFSYLENVDDLTTDNRQIADDFLQFLIKFYEQLPQMKQTPLYIFCESYGGKMTAEIALVVDKAIKDGKIDIQLKGIGLGDSWISPIDSVETWGPYLLQTGFVDQNGCDQIQNYAASVRKAVDAGSWDHATQLWGDTESIIYYVANGVDFYNVLTPISTGRKPKTRGLATIRSIDDDIDDIMQTKVKSALNLNSSYGGAPVFQYLYTDFMKPVIHIVEDLLNNTDIKVAVYNGQLDLIVDTPGTMKWVDSMKFNGSDEFAKAQRDPIVVDSIIEGAVKTYNNLYVYWVNRAGHMVPADNPAAMRYILAEITNNFSNKLD